MNQVEINRLILEEYLRRYAYENMRQKFRRISWWIDPWTRRWITHEYYIDRGWHAG